MHGCSAKCGTLLWTLFFDLFFQAAREQWSETLWANLNIQLLQDGIEGYLKQLRKLPKDVRQMAVGRALEEKMKEFRDSLPLFVDLKHEALRERHWKELMAKTGQKFDMNPETFTLANIFAMELHRYQETISEIVTCASKEMGIEKVSQTGLASFGSLEWYAACSFSNYHVFHYILVLETMVDL